MRPPATKTCNQCGKEYKPRTTLQSVCALECAIQQSREKMRLRALRELNIANVLEGLRFGEKS